MEQATRVLNAVTTFVLACTCIYVLVVIAPILTPVARVEVGLAGGLCVGCQAWFGWLSSVPEAVAPTGRDTEQI